MINLATTSDARTAFTNSGYFEMVDVDQIDAIARHAYRAALGHVDDNRADELFRAAIIAICGDDAL